MFLHAFFLFYFFPETTMERDRFMTPEEARSFGIIDHVLEKPPVLEEGRK